MRVWQVGSRNIGTANEREAREAQEEETSIEKRRQILTRDCNVMAGDFLWETKSVTLKVPKTHFPETSRGG